MKLTIDVFDGDTMSQDDLVKKIAEMMDWEVDYARSTYMTQTGNLYAVTAKDGREGVYNPVSDILTWTDDADEREYQLFSSVNDPMYQDESLDEFLDSTMHIWGEDEDGVCHLYVEG